MKIDVIVENQTDLQWRATIGINSACVLCVTASTIPEALEALARKVRRQTELNSGQLFYSENILD